MYVCAYPLAFHSIFIYAAILFMRVVAVVCLNWHQYAPHTHTSTRTKIEAATPTPSVLTVDFVRSSCEALMLIMHEYLGPNVGQCTRKQLKIIFDYSGHWPKMMAKNSVSFLSLIFVGQFRIDFTPRNRAVANVVSEKN